MDHDGNNASRHDMTQTSRGGKGRGRSGHVPIRNKLRRTIAFRYYEFDVGLQNVLFALPFSSEGP